MASGRVKLGALAVALVLLVATGGELAAEVREETLKLAGVLCFG